MFYCFLFVMVGLIMVGQVHQVDSEEEQEELARREEQSGQTRKRESVSSVPC
jgi:hypothetical protein